VRCQVTDSAKPTRVPSRMVVSCHDFLPKLDVRTICWSPPSACRSFRVVIAGRSRGHDSTIRAAWTATSDRVLLLKFWSPLTTTSRYEMSVYTLNDRK
jgi:hypothetical protein